MNTNGTKIKFGVIGCGFIGKRHIEHIEVNPESELVAVCDIKPKETLGIEHVNAMFFETAEQMFNDHLDLDVVVVATPNGLHAEHALLALRNGKHVIVEKPLGLTKEECEQVIHVSMQQNKLVFGVMQNRYSPPSVWLKEVVESGILGKIFFVQVNCFWNRDERYYKKSDWKGKKALDGGTLFTQFSHFVDIMYWLFGDIEDAHSYMNNFSHQETTEFEDTGVITFRFREGAMGCFNFSTSVFEKNLESSITIIAENGTIKVGGQYMDKVEYCNIRNYTMPELDASNPPNDYGFYKGSAANHNYVIQNTVDTLKGRTRIATNALEGMKVVEIINKMYAAHEVNGNVPRIENNFRNTKV